MQVANQRRKWISVGPPLHKLRSSVDAESTALSTHLLVSQELQIQVGQMPRQQQYTCRPGEHSPDSTFGIVYPV